eukprot:177148-Amphidinium_carterae.1
MKADTSMLMMISQQYPNICCYSMLCIVHWTCHAPSKRDRTHQVFTCVTQAPLYCSNKVDNFHCASKSGNALIERVQERSKKPCPTSKTLN